MSEQIQQTVAAVVEASEQAKTEPTQQEQSQPEKVAPSQSDEFSTKFAALSRREKQLLEKERKLKQLEESNSQKYQKASSYEERLKKVKENPSELDSILEEAGMTFEEYVNYKLGVEPEKKELTADEVYKKLKQEMLEKEQKAEEERLAAQEAQNTQIISDFQNEIESYLTKNADKYELINYQGDFNLVFDVIQEYYNTNGEVLDIEEAANHVEQHLENLVDGATKLKKFASKFAPKTEPVQPQSEVAQKIEAAVEEEKKKTASPTLSNDLNGSNSSSKNFSLSVEESKRRAAQNLRWT